MSDLSKLLSQVRDVRENGSTLRLLERHIHSPLGVIPFVGAGLSCALGYPSWTEFLIEQSRMSGIVKRIGTYIRNGQYEEAAEALLAKRLARRFEDAVGTAFGERELPNDTVGAVFQLPLICAGPVITTNFDPILEAVFDRAGKPFDKTVLGGRVDDAIQAVHLNKRLLVKLHGDHAFPQDRVLTLSEYTRAYGSPEPQGVDLSLPLPKFLRLMMQNRPLLFLGCSLNLDRTVRVLRQVVADYPALAHYALVEIPRNEAGLISRDRFLSGLGIRPIWYPHGKHEAIEAVLAHLAAGVSSNSSLTQQALRIGLHASLPNKHAEVLRSELKSAGYRHDLLKTLMATGSCQKTSHSTIFLGATILGNPKVIKLTKKKLCRLPVLRQLVGLTADIREQSTVARLGATEWIGESTEHVVEVMPLYPGITLSEMILRSRSRVTGDLLANIFDCLILMVRRLHEMEVLHRDVNPSNILISTSGRDVVLTLLDMSFACATSDRNQIPVVSHGYTAPEQQNGRAVAASDLYGVAATTYFLANGSPPSFAAKLEFEQGLRAIDIGEYYPSFALETDDDLDDGYGGPIALFRALLDPDVPRRPSELWNVVLRTHSRASRFKEETGVLDLGGFGSITLMEEDYSVRPPLTIPPQP